MCVSVFYVVCADRTDAICSQFVRNLFAITYRALSPVRRNFKRKQTKTKNKKNIEIIFLLSTS